MASAQISETIRPAYIWTGSEWVQIGDGGADGGGNASVIYSPEQPDTTNLEPGALWMDSDSEVGAGGAPVQSFKYITTTPSSQEIIADNSVDTLNFEAVGNISIVADATNDKLTFTSNGNYAGVDSIVYPDYISFDTTPETIPTQVGSLYWSEDDKTLDLQLSSDVVLSLGQEEHYPPVINTSGVQINNGELVMATGVQGDKLTIAKAVTDGSVPFEYIIGFATRNIPVSDDEGHIAKFGYVRNVNTNAYAIGTILYANPAVPGGLTSTKPDAPAYRVPIAIVTKVGEGSGVILVRMTPPSAFGETDSNVKFTNLQQGDLVVYNSSQGLWENTSQINGDLTIAGNLYVSGSATYENTQELTVQDPLIYLAANASGIYLNDIFDVGFLAAYGPHPEGGSAHYHRGLVYDKSADKWKLINNVEHPLDNYVDFDSASASFDILQLGELEAEDIIATGLVTASAFSGDGSQLTGIVSLPDQTGNAGKYLTTDGTDASWATLDLSTKADKNLEINQQTVSYQLVLSDNGKLIEISVGSANTLTVPRDANVNFPIGTQITVLQTGTGQTTIQPESAAITVNATPGLKLRAQWSSATLIKRAENLWVAIGDLTA